MTSNDFLVWFMTGFAVLYGLWIIFKMQWSIDARRCLRAESCELSRRMSAVVAARAEIDRLPRNLPYVAGGIWIAAAPLVALRVIPPGLAYGIGCLGFAACLAYAYLRGRHDAGRRAATLRPRTVGAPIPFVWYALAALAAVAVLPFVAAPSLAVAAVLVMLSTLITIALATRASTAPAVLFGDDLPLEQVVDDRVRFARAAGLLMLAYVQPYVFCGLASSLVRVPLSAASVSLTLAAWIVFTVWYAFKLLAPVRARDLTAVVSAS
jgi:hypothetical protein